MTLFNIAVPNYIWKNSNMIFIEYDNLVPGDIFHENILYDVDAAGISNPFNLHGTLRGPQVTMSNGQTGQFVSHVFSNSDPISTFQSQVTSSVSYASTYVATSVVSTLEGFWRWVFG